MLNPNEDRLNYGEILAPPPGMELDFAVGTTYSLDFDALVGACLAMGLSEETDSMLLNDPVYVFEALRRVGDKVALFCEGGQIHMPRGKKQQYILLEKMVFSVQTAKRKRKKRYPSFHPKFWLLRYTDATRKQEIYRIIVLSRNLTFDRSWDVVYYMDGHKKGAVSEKNREKNEPVCDFLQYLLKQLPKNKDGKAKAKAIRSIIGELPGIVFKPNEKAFKDYEFVPNGIERSTGGVYRFDETPLFSEPFNDIAIISPFLAPDIIKRFNTRNDDSRIRNSEYLLITRKASLVKLKPADVSNFQVYTMRDTVIEGESALAEEQSDAKSQDIHAKMYMFRKSNQTNLYLGSLNASNQAVYDNVEFMINLTSTNSYLNMEKLKSFLFGDDPDANPFQEVKPEEYSGDEVGDKQDNLNDVIKQISRSEPKAKVIPNGESFDLEIIFDQFDHCNTKDFNVTVQPLLSDRAAAFAKKMVFPAMSLDELSKFYSVLVSDGEISVQRVLVIPTDDIPEGREERIVANVLEDDKGFYKYITFLLGNNKVIAALEERNRREGSEKQDHQKPFGPALYETMLQTAAENPARFKGIDYLIKTITDDSIVPDDFKKLYDTFRKEVKIDD